MKWLIYKHTNKLNGKSYIGQTCQKPSARWNSGNNYCRSFKFGKAIDKYGWDSFSHEIIESNIETQDLANQREIYYIELFDSYKNGYNSTKGGGNYDHLGNEVVQISPDKLVIKKYASAAEAERCTGILSQNIGSCLLGTQLTAGGFFWVEADVDINEWTPPKSRKEKTIICVETKEIYNSISEASRKTNIGIGEISKCVLRQAITAGGYHWAYILEYDDDWTPVEEKKKGGPCRAIICVESSEVYESITECSILTGISTQNLSQNCCKAHRSAKNKHYAYVDEYDENWKPAPKYTTKRRKESSTLKKSVYCLETQEVYVSETEAGEKLGIDSRLIGRCCSGELVKTHGYHFCYAVDDYINFKPRETIKGQKGKRRILCVETGEIFSHAAQASKVKAVASSTLSECLNKKRLTAGGLHWEYIDI
ncbi:MAG: GIY-YIG nuclease family protein [Clostridia bacterium]|nr:GIY-YIG nuclease family protein [Clostridia bacterium]